MLHHYSAYLFIYDGYDGDGCVERANRWTHLYHAEGAQQWRGGCWHVTCRQWLVANGILDRFVCSTVYSKQWQQTRLKHLLGDEASARFILVIAYTRHFIG